MKVMTFKDIVVEVIKLSKKCEAESTWIDRKYGLDYEFGVDLIRDMSRISQSICEPHPENDKLREYLNSLSESDVEKLQTIMYVGRDEDDVPKLHQYLKRNTVDKDDAIRTIMGKGGALHIYLAEGLKVAASQRADLDSPF